MSETSESSVTLLSQSRKQQSWLGRDSLGEFVWKVAQGNASLI